jgi:hypothetical protein
LTNFLILFSYIASKTIPATVRASHIDWTIGSQMALRLLALHNGGALLLRNILNFYVRFQVFTAVAMKNGVFWDVTPCGSCKNRRFGGT